MTFTCAIIFLKARLPIAFHHSALLIHELECGGERFRIAANVVAYEPKRSPKFWQRNLSSTDLDTPDL
ncbi:hypothetical protein KOR42_07500 [Thalassoglobus neptunius]|uniref:Uncharacterized protein n=1 Tax=Thalassoglobus neptunius TaxID=1938619 RepID=A0A5C5X3G3_9PLAN|nr:hypothetical protein KOR42_07500 [Thalassoglobus neptunius]